MGLTQTLAWGTTYYLPAILANDMATELGIATPWIFTAFSTGLLLARSGTYALTVTAGFGLAAFTVLMLLPVKR